MVTQEVGYLRTSGMDNSKPSGFFRVRSTHVCVWWLSAVILNAAAWINPAYGSGNLATMPAQGRGFKKPQEQLSASQEELAKLQERLQAVAASLQGLEDADESVPPAELAEQKDTLITERAAPQNELKFLESAHTAWQAALDACENDARLRHELAQFQTEGQSRAEDFVASDVTALQAQLDQIRSANNLKNGPRMRYPV